MSPRIHNWLITIVFGALIVAGLLTLYFDHLYIGAALIGLALISYWIIGLIVPARCQACGANAFRRRSLDNSEGPDVGWNEYYCRNCKHVEYFRWENTERLVPPAKLHTYPLWPIN